MVLAVLAACYGCSRQARPAIPIHYLGHASFLMDFPDGPTVLTDFGASGA